MESAFPRFGDSTEKAEGLFDAGLGTLEKRPIRLVNNLPLDCAFYLINLFCRAIQLCGFFYYGATAPFVVTLKNKLYLVDQSRYVAQLACVLFRLIMRAYQ